MMEDDTLARDFAGNAFGATVLIAKVLSSVAPC